jgi:hypothetical protein
MAKVIQSLKRVPGIFLAAMGAARTYAFMAVRKEA